MITFDIVFNIHDLDLPLDELVIRSTDFLPELTDPELINEAWVHAREDGRSVFGCEPYSLAEFLSVIIGNVHSMVSGKTVWLNMLESSLTFRAVEGDMEICYWRGISSQQIQSALGTELVSGLCYELKCLPTDLVAVHRPPIQVQVTQQQWLGTSLHWARQFAHLVREIQAREKGIILNPADESNVSAHNELKVFLSTFSQHESDVAQMVETPPFVRASLL
jgi:hypothetical protein